MRSARLGLVVTKRGNPKAVRRNRLKRIIREQFRQRANSLPAVDIVVQVFGQIDDSQLAFQLQQRFTQVTQQLQDDDAAPV
jgi:ribonuclease P protein component